MPQNIIGMKCIDCDIILTEDSTYLFHRRTGMRLCKKCSSKRVIRRLNTYKLESPEKYRINLAKTRIATKEWHRKNRELHNNHMREYARQYILNGKKLPQKKRQRPNDICEACHTIHHYLAYHHWDNARPWLGVWICRPCHSILEAIDHMDTHPRVQSYFRLRASIIAENS